MNRLPTGIPGFDELIEGGFPEGSSILLSGGAGTGKSIFALQYLYYGAKERREPSVYITLEEGPHNLWWNMQRFKWDLLPLEKENLLKIYKFEPSTDSKISAAEQIKKIVDKARDLKAKRMVIDSITAFSYWFSDPTTIRLGLYTLVEELRKLSCTTILTSEVSGKKDEYSRFGVEEFLSDGLVMLYFFPPNRSIFVRKMRGTKHSPTVHPMEIGEEGLKVNANEEILWEAIKD
ncbi:hypothetical protein AUJ14_02165 [Candidatus Micrarchaeota archaeon CG1_02_55_22]|nr:MAG: hypothetical protein AUJ14_02165 [Candidatus Micrarchaeota archaeon CG1_02_55_22]